MNDKEVILDRVLDNLDPEFRKEVDKIVLEGRRELVIKNLRGEVSKKIEAEFFDKKERKDFYVKKYTFKYYEQIPTILENLGEKIKNNINEQLFEMQLWIDEYLEDSHLTPSQYESMGKRSYSLLDSQYESVTGNNRVLSENDSMKLVKRIIEQVKSEMKTNKFE